jgi:hypothetical protein
MGDAPVQNVKSAAAALIGRAIMVPDWVASRGRSPRARSTGGARRGVLARTPLINQGTELSASAIEARLRTVIASALAWIMPEREPHVYRSTAPYHFDRVFRTWQ